MRMVLRNFAEFDELTSLPDLTNFPGHWLERKPVAPADARMGALPDQSALRAVGYPDQYERER